MNRCPLRAASEGGRVAGWWCLLPLRGEAVLDEVEGIPDEYLRMNGTHEMVGLAAVHPARTPGMHPSRSGMTVSVRVRLAMDPRRELDNRWHASGQPTSENAARTPA
jgi:hypothetical protein